MKTLRHEAQSKGELLTFKGLLYRLETHMQQPSEELKLELKKLIVDTLKIPDIKPEQIGDDESLFEGDLGIDSVDALELVMALQRKYNVHIDDQNLGRFIIKSVNTIAEFIVKEQEKMKSAGE